MKKLALLALILISGRANASVRAVMEGTMASNSSMYLSTVAPGGYLLLGGTVTAGGYKATYGVVAATGAFSAGLSAGALTVTSGTFTSGGVQVASGNFLLNGSNGFMGINVTPIDRFEVGGAVHVSSPSVSSHGGEQFMDYNNGSMLGRLFVRGGSASVNPTWSLSTSRSDASNILTPISIDTLGALNISDSGIATSSLTVSGYNTAGAWYSWTPVWAGYSVSPGVVSATYMRVGKTVFAQLTATGSGTSNNTSHTITLPLPAVRVQAEAGTFDCVDNGGTVAFGRGVTAAASAVMTLYKDAAASAWTNSGTSYCQFNVTYEAQ